MISRFLTWLKDNRQWKKDHLSSWADLRGVGPNGITGFQLRAVESLKQSGLDLEFERKGEREIYLHAAIPNTDTEVFLYANGAQVVGEHNYFIGEEWDFRTAVDLIDKLVASTIERARAT